MMSAAEELLWISQSLEDGPVLAEALCGWRRRPQRAATAGVEGSSTLKQRK